MPELSYLCRFKFINEIREVESNRGLSDFTAGFWVDEDLKLCVASKSKYWIPPHCVIFVKKKGIHDD